MKKIFTILFVLSVSISAFAGSGIYETYVSTSLNGGAQSYLGSGGSNPAFQDANLGTVNPNSNTLVMKLQGLNSWNDNGCDVQTAKMKIRVYLSTVTPAPGFTNVNLIYQGSSGNNKFWNVNSTATDINLLANCFAAGTYNVDIQFDYTNNNISCGSPTTTDIMTATFVATAPLPITLSRFEGKNQELSNLLTWTTETETNASHFELEKSNNNLIWSKITNVKALGNSQRTQNYNFTDENPSKGANYYRLKMVDRDGTFSYSKAIALFHNPKNKVDIFPNPAQDFLNILIENNTNQATVEIFNFNGQTVKRNLLTSNQLIISDLANGIYFIQVTDENNQVIAREKLLKN